MADFLAPKTPQNLLPRDGTVHYYGKIMPEAQAQHYFNVLLDGIAWQNDEAYLFGKHFITKRKAAWYADLPLSYTYSNRTKTALPWTPALLEIKLLIEQLCPYQFNSCLLNLYHDGDEGMAWHSDDEKALEKYAAIASLTLGAERKFGFKHKIDGETRFLQLEHGSLLVMKDETQEFWLHRLPKSKRVSTARINLTFRKMLLPV